MSHYSHLVEREKPIWSSPASCSLTTKRAVSEDDLVTSENISGVKDLNTIRSEVFSNRPETFARAKTCEYLRQRSYAEESKGYGPILPVSNPVHIGRHGIEIKHCCVSPCNTPGVLDEQMMKRLTIKVRSEINPQTIETDSLFSETGSDDPNTHNTTEELEDCDMTSCGREKAAMDRLADTSEETLHSMSQNGFEYSLEESHHQLNTRNGFEHFNFEDSCNTNEYRSNPNCTDVDDKPSQKQCEQLCEVSNNNNNISTNVKNSSIEICGDHKCADTEDKLVTNQCEKLCGDTNNNEIMSDETSYFKRTQSVNKVNPISNLNHLIEELHRVFKEDHVNVDYVEMVMKAYKSNPREWKKYAKFDKFKYTRNLVDAGNDKFNLMILCWGEGHGSSIHDHADAHCFMKMLDGSLQETRYTWPEEGNEEQRGEDEERPLHVMGKSTLKLNDVCYINDSLGLHRVENSSYSDRAVSLHLYSPPFNACSVFNERTGRKMISKVTFWSKFGKKDKNINEDKNQEFEDN
ncbi:hypothetical protein WDU94_010157 [Cyamophila willieti]